MIDANRIRRAYDTARRDLLAERDVSGHWVGALSSSALSTATAVSALAVVEQHRSRTGGEQASLRPLIEHGIDWLARCQNDDGGWGDTDKSRSNIATTMLARASFSLSGTAQQHASLLCRAEQYVNEQGSLAALRRRYGKDKTFVAPILTNCALAGLVPWREVAPLPFELACLPHRLLGILRLPVVSYAIPALVAIGQARYFHLRPRNPLTRLIRRLALHRSRCALERMQPASGGFLEATPLTSFVVMSLASIGCVDHPVVHRGVAFLQASIRQDGSWPIDTNLATWTTTLAVNALAEVDWDGARPECLRWLLSCQHQEAHPMTRAAPGGWGWSDLDGAVPDVDDTSGALLALEVFSRSCSEADRHKLNAAARSGVKWLLGVQNGDGGWPTFCRGWGALPFDRSGCDLTAHAIRALLAWRNALPGRVDAAVRRGFDHLARRQHADGRWIPLWFGNEHQPDEENPVYGTARVLLAYRDAGQLGSVPAQRGFRWLAANRNVDGGWGGDHRRASSVEETAVATEALLAADDTSLQVDARQGLTWLVEALAKSRHRETSPIGFYFARLWYYERLYPLIFTVAALGQVFVAGQSLIPGESLLEDSHLGHATSESPTD